MPPTISRICLACAVLFCARTQAQTMVDTSIVMDDAVTLDALYALPDTPPPGTGWPAIIWIHGFNESKEDVREKARQTARKGYASVGFSVRGQGNSGGVFDFFTSERIQEDMRAVISFTKALPRVNADRVGVVGASQGGLLAWTAAAYGMGIRAVVSRICNGRFDENWSADNTLNWTFARSVALTQVRLDPAVKDSVNAAAQSGNHGFVESFLASHSTAPLETGVSIPVAMFLSYYDGYFDPNAALRQFARIPSPKRIILYPGGHTQPAQTDQRAFVDDAQTRWLSYWLNDDEDCKPAPDSAVVFFDASTGNPVILPQQIPGYWMSPTDPLPSGIASRTWYFAPSGIIETPFVYASTRTIIYTNLLGSTPAAYRSAPFTEDAIIAATFGHAELFADGSGQQFQVNLLLYDVDPDAGTSTPLSRGQCQVARNIPGVRDTIRLELNTTLHTIRKGHALEARIHTGIAIAPNPLTDFGNYVIGPPFNSTNSVYIGGATPSSFTLYTIDPAVLSDASRPPSPVAIGLLDSYPNPFNPEATIRYSLEIPSRIRLSIVDALGRTVAILADLHAPAGMHRVVWDAAGSPSGVYFVRFESDGAISTRGIVLVR